MMKKFNTMIRGEYTHFVRFEDIETILKDRMDEHATCANSEDKDCTIHTNDNWIYEKCDGTKWDTCKDYSAKEPELYEENKTILEKCRSS